MSKAEIRKQVALALSAAQDKKAEDVALLELPRESSAFTDYFLICSGSNPRQVQAIADSIDEALSKQMGMEPNNREGYQNAEWVLLDYVDFVCHIFSADSRKFYDLERLWKSATQLGEGDLLKPEKAEKKTASPVKKAAKAPAKKSAKVPAKKAVAKKAARPAAKKSISKKAIAKKSAKKSAKPAKKAARRR